MFYNTVSLKKVQKKKVKKMSWFNRSVVNKRLLLNLKRNTLMIFGKTFGAFHKV